MVRGKSREDAILAAARTELMARGYEGMTIDGVAARARSSKATVYRRWKNKAELVKAMLDNLDATDNSSIPVTGALRSDLVAVLNTMRAKVTGPYIAMIQDLVLASKRDAVLAEALGRHIQNEALSPFHDVLARHFPRHDKNFELIHDVAEAMVVRQLQTGARIDAAFVKRVVDRVLLPLLADNPKRGRR